MMRKIGFYMSIAIMSLLFGFGCAMQESSSKPAVIVVPGGTVLPTLGIGFDANYDPSLDNVVPGYKILTIAYTNNSMDIIQMDPQDEWWVENRKGKKVKAVINLRDKNPDAWAGLQKRLKILLEYPLLIPIGTTQTIDLLFKDKENLAEFKSVIFRMARSKQEFKILPREN